MKQVVQPIGGGPVRVVDVPRPVIGPTEVLVQTRASVISAGTEGAVTQLARASLLGKARARPDLVRQVVRKARADGLRQTIGTVRSRLDDDLPLGYSAAGTVLEVGEAVPGIRPGRLVATAGAGKANHAEIQAVPGLLCAAVPDGVSAEDAAFATVGAIALHALRLAAVGPGDHVVVLGLGLLGQLTARLAQAAGCLVAGVDLAEHPVERARARGAFALVEAGEETTAALLEWSRGRGADAVLVTASTPSSEPLRRTPARCRDRATVVVVGDVGVELQRTPFYERELSLRFARSYGPGRYDPSYEDWGVDYPLGHVRWTEGRNLEAVLDLIATGRLVVHDLLTHRFPLAQAPRAYELVVSRSEPFMAIGLQYPDGLAPERPLRLRGAAPARTPGVGVIGAGAFAAEVLVPGLRAAGLDRFVAVASASGLSARRLAERARFEQAVSGPDAVIDHPEVDVVVIATPHELHGPLAARALRAGKHVFYEKPLALSRDELDDVTAAWEDSDRVLFVGFNRRWSAAVLELAAHVGRAAGPLVITYRVNAGALPLGHWYRDRRQGGRVIGEVCHFVDTCAVIAGADVTAARMLAVGRSERLLAQDAVISLVLGDDALASVVYASGGSPAVGKERVEVLGRGGVAELVDFRTLVVDGRAHPVVSGDKGHRAQLAAFRAALRGGLAPTRSMLRSSAATLDLVETAGAAQDPGACHEDGAA